MNSSDYTATGPVIVVEVKELDRLRNTRRALWRALQELDKLIAEHEQVDKRDTMTATE